MPGIGSLIREIHVKITGILKRKTGSRSVKPMSDAFLFLSQALNNSQMNSPSAIRLLYERFSYQTSNTIRLPPIKWVIDTIMHAR